MDKKTIYSKTGKGVLEIKNKAGKLSKDLVKVLTLVDGKSTIADLMAKAKFDDAEMDKAIVQLSAGGYIKEFANTSTGVTSASGASGAYVDDLDFTSSLTSSSARANPYQSAQTEWRQRESADRAKAEQEAKRKREEEEKAKKEQAAKQAREEAAKLTKVEAERKAKEAAALKQREETERKAKIEAEAMAQTTRDLQKILEKERLALEESEKKKQEEVARRNKEEAEARARDEAERKRREEEERKRKEEEDRKRREEEERRRKEDEERKRKDDEERRRREEAERKRAEEERKRKEEEDRKRREEEDRKRREEEERRRREEEERKRKEEEERRRREEEERKRKEEEERKRREEEEARRREEEERKRKEEEERKRKEEEEARRREEEERKRKEEEERKRREEEERRQRREEEDRRRQEEDERRRKEDEAVEAREREERDRRRGEEDGRRREEDEKRRLEDEAREREEGESRRREEEESARRREEDEARRRREEEAESRRRKEEEEARRREEEERVREEVAAKLDVSKFDLPKADAPRAETSEFDVSGLKWMEDRIAAEFEKQQEAIRKREEEEERRREQDEQARLAIERAEREEEARAEAERREAEDRERRDRMEQERAEREERERKRQEEKEQRIREAEERKIAAAHERQRQEEMKVEAERRSREDALASRRKDQEERDRKRAEVQSIKKAKAIRSPLDVAKPFIIGVVVVVALLVGGVQLVPMNSYIPAVEKLASDHIKEPVTIGSMKVSILSGFIMNLENVKIGTTQDVKIDRVSLSPEFGSVFGSVKVVRRIDVDSVTVAQEVLPRLPKWLDAALADKTVQVGRIVFRNVKLESATLKLPPMDADLRLDADGGIEHARLSDGKLDVDLKPRNGEVEIEVTANKGWVSPIGPPVEFTDFSFKGVASRGQVRIPEFKALLYGGAAKGSATLNFSGPWSLEGELTTERVNLQELMAAYTQAAKSSGQLESRFRYALSGADLPSLFAQPRMDGSFVIRKGDLDGVDLVRALQTGGRENVQGGATKFEEISGTLAIAGERYQFRNMKLGAGVLSASGGFDVNPGNDISGKVYVELKSQAAQIRGNYALSGSLKAIVLKPN